MVVLAVIAHACSVVTRDGVTGSAKQLNLRLVQQLLRVTCGVCVMMAWVFFVLLARFFFVCFVVDPTFIAGDLGLEFARSV